MKTSVPLLILPVWRGTLNNSINRFHTCHDTKDGSDIFWSESENTIVCILNDTQRSYVEDLVTSQWCQKKGVD